MPFKFKLSKRMAIIPRCAPVLVAFGLPQCVDIDSPYVLEGTFLGILVLLWRAVKRMVDVKLLYLVWGERREKRVGINRGPRVWDRQPCHHFFVPRTKWVVRVALPKVPKVW